VLPIFITIGHDYKALYVTPSVTINYSIKISQLDTTASPVNLTLSASSPIPGVTLAVSPKELTFVGTHELVTLGISVAPTVNSSILPVEIMASSADGATNATFDFSVNRSLIVVLPLGGLAPPTLHVTVGQTVTWLNFMGSTGGGDPVTANVALADGSAASLSLGLNDLWSHTFDKSGTYLYHVTFFDVPPTTSGVVIVE
jgi:plastocyanin